MNTPLEHKELQKALGKYCFDAAEVNTRIAQGFQLLGLSSDAGLLSKAAREAFNAVNTNPAA